MDVAVFRPSATGGFERKRGAFSVEPGKSGAIGPLSAIDTPFPRHSDKGSASPSSPFCFPQPAHKHAR
jgi:hypothetical protein